MLEIVVLYFLCKKNALLAEQKKLSKSRWVITTIFYWILFEILMIALFSSFVKMDAEVIQEAKTITNELLLMMGAGLLGGYLGYLLVRKRLENMPDSTELDNM
ncbi:hypothetical protein [uncultured Cytophaga sp.]|uniref:hypothetical protein n=1 Tax=uncultured Cytophaga sp. TaxID=160238 RepID=UPI00260D5D34|nr:hypothetical protein [uncultured Cytophaga sp.]